MTERELLQKAFHVIEIEAPNALILDEIISCAFSATAHLTHPFVLLLLTLLNLII